MAATRLEYTFFFHLSTLQRSHFNRTTRLRSLSGIWIEQKAGPQCFISITSFDIYLLLIIVKEMIKFCLLSLLWSHWINEIVLSLISDDDIGWAVFQLNGSKPPGLDEFF